jgi:insulysin
MASANSYIVWEDAAHIKALTKPEMIEFFEHYIVPASPSRAKLAIHLHAQGTSKKPSISMVEEGMKLLNVKAEEKPIVLSTVEGNGTETYVIDDVRAFKSKLAVTPGPQPVKDLSEFEETDSKL